MSISASNLCFYKESIEGTSSCDEVTIELRDPIVFDPKKRYALGVRYISFKNAFLNISSTLGNNKFYYYSGTKSADRTITIPNGAYSYGDLNALIEREQTTNLDYVTDATGNITYDVVLSVSAAQMRFELILQALTTVDFRPADTPRALLGYASAEYSDSYSTAPNIPNIQAVTTVYLHTNLIHGTYYSTDSDSKAIKSDIYSSYLVTNAPSTYNIYESNTVRYVPIKPTDLLHEIKFWMTDSNDIRVGGLTGNEFHYKLDFEITGI